MSYTPIYTYKHQYSQLAAGSLTMWAPITADGTAPAESAWRPLNGLIQTPQWSFSSAQDDDTVVADVAKEYRPGIYEGAESSIEFYEYLKDKDQADFIALAQEGGNYCYLKTQYSNGVINQAKFAILGTEEAAKGQEDKISMTVNLKMSGKFTRTNPEPDTDTNPKPDTDTSTGS